MTTTVQPTDVMVTCNGMNFHYLDWGNEGAPVMLLLHGLRGHCHSWDDVSARFCSDYHVLALDQRGRGETDWAPRGDYSTDAFVADIEEFCYTVGFDKFTLVGHSMGGRNSMAFAGRNPGYAGEAGHRRHRPGHPARRAPHASPASWWKSHRSSTPLTPSSNT